MTKILPSIQSKLRRYNFNLNNIQRKNNLNLNNNDSVELFESPILNKQQKSKNLLKLIIDKINFNGRSLHCFLLKQLFFAQCLKLLVLFSIAIAQILFLHPFLELFSHLEEYSAKFEFLQHLELKQKNNLIIDSVHDLNEYKKNIWMTVAVLCVALSTSSFFLFLLPSNCLIRQWNIYMVGILDAFSFACLPFLFSTRGCYIQKIKFELNSGLVQAHKLSSAEKFMNEAQCSIQPREKLPLCSELIIRSLFPIDLLKFLLILCAMTLSYLLVAYLIYWCIKHWIPHSNNKQSSSILCHCYLNNNNNLIINSSKSQLQNLNLNKSNFIIINQEELIPNEPIHSSISIMQ